MSPLPFGVRGEHQLSVTPHQLLPRELARDLAEIPGIALVGNEIRFSWDAAAVAAERLGIQLPAPPMSSGFEAPGLGEYEALGMKEKLRPYQKDAIAFLLRRPWAFLSLPQRTGKTPAALGAAVLCAAKRVLVCAPSPVVWNWAAEIASWIGEAAVVLEGLDCRRARRFCTVCLGAGRGCSACRQLNGQSYGYQILDVRKMNRRTSVAGSYVCARHSDGAVTTDPTNWCPVCAEDLQEQLRRARFILTNYDLLAAPEQRAKTGKVLGSSHSLPGWAEVLRALAFDLAILDESHILRGRARKATRRGKTRRDRMQYALHTAARVWLLTGTPIYSFTRDLWSQLDLASGGLWGRARTFETRYCGGGINAHGGWQADGRTLLADTELEPRLRVVMYRRERSEIAKDLPEKQRIIQRLDNPDGVGLGTPASAQELAEVLRKTLEAKAETVIDAVMADVENRVSVVVFTHLRDSAVSLHALIQAEVARRAKDERRFRGLNVGLWLATGAVSNIERFRLAQDYRDHAQHKGVAVLVATISSMETGLSLRGAGTVHFAELHHAPAAMLQAEDRPYEIGVRGLTVIYYVLQGSADEDQLERLKAKFETQAQLTGDESAKAAQNAISGLDAADEDVDAAFRRLTANWAGKDTDNDDDDDA